MKGQAYVILLIVVLIIVSVFAVTNVAPVEVKYFFWSGQSPLILVILFSVLMGGIITASAGSVRFFQMRRELKHLSNQNEQMKIILNENNLLDHLEKQENSTITQKDVHPHEKN